LRQHIAELSADKGDYQFSLPIRAVQISGLIEFVALILLDKRMLSFASSNHVAHRDAVG
jgi:hypothetical protein